MAMDRETQLMGDATRAGITSSREMANFMAQVGHESGGLTKLEESFRYTRDIAQIPVKSAWREGADALEAARKEALQGRPEALAELMYGGRMGNDEPGDGYKYRGRGYMQLTGKDNYREAGEALGLDLVNHPDLASKPEYASKIAVWYWQNHVPEAAREDVKAATKAINGGYNGLTDREQRFEKWERTLTPDVMQRLQERGVGLPVATPSVSSGRDPMSDGMLVQGEKGAAVKTMQEKLAALGYTGLDGKPLVPDKDFGTGTLAAVKQFQRDHGLKDDGKAGPKTLEALEAAAKQHAAGKGHDAVTPRVPAHEVGKATSQAPVHEAGKAAAGTATQTLAPGLADAGHPDNTRFGQAVEKLEGLEAQRKQAGLPALFGDRQELEKAAGQVAFESKVAGLKQIDSIMARPDGQGVFAVEGKVGDPAAQRVYVDRAQAVGQSVDASTQQLNDFNKQFAQESTAQAQQVQTQAQQTQAQAQQTQAAGPGR